MTVQFLKRNEADALFAALVKLAKEIHTNDCSPHQGLSEARRGGKFFLFFIHDPPRGRPAGGGGVHRK